MAFLLYARTIEADLYLGGLWIDDEGLEGSQDVSHEALHPTHPGRFKADYGIKTHAYAIAEMLSLGIIPSFDESNVKWTSVLTDQHRDTVGQTFGYIGSVGEVVAPAYRQNPEFADGPAFDTSLDQAVYDLVYRTVTTASYRYSVAFSASQSGNLGGMPDSFCQPDIIVRTGGAQEAFDLFPALAGFALARSGIQDYQQTLG